MAALSAKSDVIIHLVHGTWPRGLLRQFVPSLVLPAPSGRLWSQAGSSFAESLSENLPGINLRIQTYSWSGRNSQLARERAALGLQRHIRSAAAEVPDAMHYLVGHSHGGNVALLAVSDSKARLPDSVRGVICLATPFLTFFSLRGSRLEQVLRLFPLLTPPFAALIAAGLLLLTGATASSALLRGVLAAVMLAPPVLFLASLRRREIAKRYLRLRRRSSPNSPKLLAVLRAPGDEATLALALPQLVGLWSRWTWRLLVRPLVIAAEAIPRVAFVFLMVVLPLAGLATLLLPGLDLDELAAATQVFLAVSLLPMAFLIVSFLIMMPAAVICAVALGPELLVAGFVQEVFVDATPAGWQGTAHCVLPDRKTRTNGGMRHSIHELNEVRRRVARFILEDLARYERRRRQTDRTVV